LDGRINELLKRLDRLGERLGIGPSVAAGVVVFILCLLVLVVGVLVLKCRLLGLGLAQLDELALELIGCLFRLFS